MRQKVNKCKRCGRPYDIQDIWVCPCHPMFDPNKSWDDMGGCIDLSKTPEPALQSHDIIREEERI